MKPPTKTRQAIKLKQNQKFTNNAEGNVFQMKIFQKKMNTIFIVPLIDRSWFLFVATEWEIYV